MGGIRSIIAFGTLLTMFFNDFDIVMKQYNYQVFLTINQINLFQLLKDHLLLAKVISIVSLLIVIFGYYPRFTCFLHWYITFSFHAAFKVPNGGDMIGAILTLMTIPICLGDSRKNHWSNTFNGKGTPLLNMMSFIVLQFIKLQIAYLYFDSFISKLFVKEWVSGTSLWYYSHHSIFGYTYSPLIPFLLKNAIICLILTWGVLLVEFLLSISIFHPTGSRFKYILFINGVLLHLSIAYFIGLVSFFCTMFAALMLLLLPLNKSLYENYMATKNNIFPWRFN